MASIYVTEPSIASSNSNAGLVKASNAAQDSGGIYSPAANLTLTNTVVANNLAGFQGGGIGTDTGIVTVNGSAVINNGADSAGGGFFTNHGNFSVTDAN